MTGPLTATELSRSLSDVLNRVRYRGDTFDIVRNGEVVARLVPAQPQPHATVATLWKVLTEASDRDPDFAADLEAVQREQPALEADPWDS